MAFQQRDMTGALFRNEKKGSNERAPGYSGTALIDGREYRIAGWVKEGRNGGRFFSLAFTAKDDQREHASSDDDVDAAFGGRS